MDIIRKIVSLVKMGIPILITEEGWKYIIKTSQEAVDENAYNEEYVLEA